MMNLEKIPLKQPLSFQNIVKYTASTVVAVLNIRHFEGFYCYIRGRVNLAFLKQYYVISDVFDKLGTGCTDDPKSTSGNESVFV